VDIPAQTTISGVRFVAKSRQLYHPTAKPHTNSKTQISVRYFDQKQNYNVRSLLHIIYINMEPLFYFGHTQEEQFFRKCRQEHLK
jgi:hypothetical protein